MLASAGVNGVIAAICVVSYAASNCPRAPSARLSWDSWSEGRCHLQPLYTHTHLEGGMR